MAISKRVQKLAETAVDALFERLKARLMGPSGPIPKLGAKNLVFGFVPEFTLGGLFSAASKEEGVSTPNGDLLSSLLGISSSYLDAHKQKAKAQVAQALQSHIRNSKTKTPQNTLETQLSEIWEKVHADVKKVVETETTVVRNMGVDDAIHRLSAMQGIEDPTVYFVTVRDGHRCDECTRLHLQPDKTTPRVWKRSQVGAGYHKKGDDYPKVGGLHPHCRCVMSVLMPGFGFDASGRVVWKKVGWDEHAHQVNP